MWHDGGCWNWGGAGWFANGWPVMLAIVGLLLAGLVVLAILLARRTAAPGHQDGPSPGEPRYGRAEQILDERLARGEIDEEEYRRRRDLLGIAR